MIPNPAKSRPNQISLRGILGTTFWMAICFWMAERVASAEVFRENPLLMVLGVATIFLSPLVALGTLVGRQRRSLYLVSLFFLGLLVPVLLAALLRSGTP